MAIRPVSPSPAWRDEPARRTRLPAGALDLKENCHDVTGHRAFPVDRRRGRRGAVGSFFGQAPRIFSFSVRWPDREGSRAGRGPGSQEI